MTTKWVLKIRNPNPSAANNWNVPVAHITFWPWSINAQVSGKERWSQCSVPRKWFQLFKWAATTAISPLSCAWRPMWLWADVTQNLNFIPKLLAIPDSLQTSLLKNHVNFFQRTSRKFFVQHGATKRLKKTTVRGTSVPPFGLVQSIHEFYHG